MTLQDSRFTPLVHLMAAALLVGGCSSDSTDDTGEPTTGPSEVTIAAATGGTLTATDGKATLQVAAGALGADTTLTVVRSSSTVSPDALASEVYDFGPDGLTFSTPVTLCLEPKAGTVIADACLGFLDEGASPPAWTCADETLEVDGDKMCGQTDHFTLFAIVIGLNNTKKDPEVPLEAILVENENSSSVQSTDGGALVTFPAGAVKEPVQVSVKPGNPSVEAKLISTAYDLQPHDLELLKPATVCLRANAETTEDACLGYIDESADPPEWRCEDEALSTEEDRFCGKTSRLGLFAVVLGLNTGKNEPNQNIDAKLGGTVVSENGEVTFAVPAGALSEDATITIGPDADAPTKCLGSDAWSISGVEGELLKPATLCIRAKEGVTTDGACLATLGSNGVFTCIDEALEADDEARLCGRTSHNSSFALLLSGSEVPDECKDDEEGWLGDFTLKSGGSSFTIDGGNLEIHADAKVVFQDTTITVFKKPEDPNAHSTVYELTPAGLTFEAPLELCISPKGDLALTGDNPACLAFKNAADEWECEDSCLEKKGDLLCGETDHFTNFALLLSGDAGGKKGECDDDEPLGDFTIPPAGTSLTIDGGSLVIHADAKAVFQDTTISVFKKPADPNAVSTVYELTPDGQTFEKALTLCFKPNADYTVTKDDPPCLAFINADGKWQCEDACLKSEGDLICGKTDHFTSFALLLSSNAGEADKGCGDDDDWNVGPAGGTISTTDGSVTLTIPEGALDTEVPITIKPAAAGVSSSAPASAFTFGPDGLQFNVPISMCMQLKGEPSAGQAVCLASPDADGSWACVDYCLPKKNEQYCGETDHFSDYGLLIVEAVEGGCE